VSSALPLLTPYELRHNPELTEKKCMTFHSYRKDLNLIDLDQNTLVLIDFGVGILGNVLFISAKVQLALISTQISFRYRQFQQLTYRFRRFLSDSLFTSLSN